MSDELESTSERARAKELLLSNGFGADLESPCGYKDTIQKLSERLKRVLSDEGKTPTQVEGAVNQYRGMWFEFIIGLQWLRESARLARQGEDPLVAIPFPKRTELPLEDVWEPSCRELVKALQMDLDRHGVTMVASNPDMLLLRWSRLCVLSEGKLSAADTWDDALAVSFLEGLPLILKGRLSYEDLCGVLSLKTSLRVDRKVQPLQEANRIKSIRKYIRTRVWMRVDAPFLFYVVLMEKGGRRVANSPESFYQNVLLYSIISIDEQPAPAVDGVLRVVDQGSLREAVRQSNAAVVKLSAQ